MTAKKKSQASSPSQAVAGTASDKRWLFGPVPDLLLGCGVGYALFIALFPQLGLDTKTVTQIGFLLSFLIATPHYGATLLRVYSNRSDLQKYALFTLYASALVWLGFVVGLYDLRVGSFLITLYFTWSPWHYAGQNYGLGVMFLRRRGVPLPDRTKRFLYASFLLSYVLTFLVMHRIGGQGGYGVGNFMGTRYDFMAVPVPGGTGIWSLFGLVFASYIGATVTAATLLLRSTAARELIPVACLVVTQALWFVVPQTWTWVTGERLESDTIAFMFVWAILGHSIQYLWVTTYYAVGTKRGRPRWTHLAATMAGGAIVWTLPAVLFSAQWIGTHPYNMGLFLMIAAGVNLQHFVLDGAIWKLRDTGVGSVLLAQPSIDVGDAAASTWPTGLRASAWVVGTAMFVVGLAGAWESTWHQRATDAGDAPRAASARARLVALGRDDPRFHLSDAQRALNSGDFNKAGVAAARSLALYPTAEAWFVTGIAHHKAERFDAALGAYRESVTMDPKQYQAWHRAGVLLARRDNYPAALDALVRANALAPDDRAIAADLAQLRSSPPPEAGDQTAP